MNLILRLVPLFALALLVFPSAALAQTRAEAPAPATTTAAPTVTVVVDHGRRVYRSNQEIVVPGDVQRPYAFAVSGRSPLGYTALESRESFVQGVVEAVRREPF